jgi:N-acetylmuramoyl-L-alanine amidase
MEARDPPLNARPLPVFSAIISVVLLLGLAAALSSQPAAPSLTMLSKEGRRSMTIALVGDQEFVALDDLASTFGLAVQESLGAITVSYKGRTIILTPDQSLASVSGRLISLPAPPSRNGRRWLVPVEFISRALAPIYDARIELRKPSRLLLIGDVRVPRILVRYDALGASSGRLTVDATPAANSTVTQDNQRLTIKFDVDALDLPNPPLAPQGGQSLVQDVRALDQTSLSVDLGPRFAGFRSATQPVDMTMRLTIDLLAAQPTETAPSTPAAPQPPSPPELPPAFGIPLSPIRTIAIDAGHGGDDEGARGAQGTKEKDLTLAVARRAKGIIEARLGIRVLLTRDDDRNVPLDERTAIANNNKADLFLSLHVNASLRKSTTGASIFYAAFDKSSPPAGAPGGVERLPTFGGGLRDIEMVPWDLAQTRHVDQSTAFATVLREQLANRVPLAPRAVDSAALRVLESANMPAVLIELGYLTNSDQEKLLAGDGFQATFVQALYDAVVRFRDALAAGGTQ